MTSNSIIVRLDAIRSFSSASMTGSYQQVGTALGHPTRLLKMVNNTTQDIAVSFDGTTDNDFVPANGFCLYDMTTNKTAQGGYFSFAIGTKIYVKGTAGTGTFYIMAVYGQGE
jgi:hypothetical protein